MPLLPKLSPLQSRLAASLIASIMVFALYFAVSLPQFAYAADVDSIRREDRNHERLLDLPYLELDTDELDLREADRYEALFVGYDREIIGRVPAVDAPTVLINNRMDLTNVEQGQTVSYSFLNASVFGALSPNTTGLPSPVRLRSIDLELEDEKRTLGEDFDWKAEKGSMEDIRLRPRQSPSADHRTVYITVNACVQPEPIINSTTDPPPQLELYVSLSGSNTNPGPNGDASTQQMITLEQGAGIMTVNATGDVYIGVYGPNTTAYKNVWSAQIAASIDAPYHFYHNVTDTNLRLVDSDGTSALLVTGNLTDEPSSSSVYQGWMESVPPFVIFGLNQDDTSLNGLQNSYCALQQYASFGPTAAAGDATSVQASITNRGNSQPKQQFYVNALNSGATYNVALAVNGNSTASGDGVVGGGGQVWPMANFTTLSDGNCALIFNLSFCSQTAYAVPANPQNFPNFTSLAAFYDNATQAQYQFFENVQAQIPCETTSSAQYSLARNCSDCAAAYQEWLCSVTIPRCADFSSTLPWLQERAMGQPFPNGTFLPSAQLVLANNSVFLNASRNPNIDSVVQPGPYKELLPCVDLCHNIVQSCSSAMGFACPRPGRPGFNVSYGMKTGAADAGALSCNYPGAEFGQPSGAVGLPSPRTLLFVALAVTGLMFI